MGTGDYRPSMEWPETRFYPGEVTEKFKLDQVCESLITEINITVVEGKTHQSKKADQLFASKNFPGYWHKGIWHDPSSPLKTSKPDQNSSVSNVFKNKILIRLGDSLARMTDSTLMKGIDNKKILMGRYAEFDILNITKDYYNPECDKDLKGKDSDGKTGLWGVYQLNYESINFTSIQITHGLPFLREECLANTIWSSDVIDRMDKFKWHSKNHIVFLTHGAHFLTWDPIIYYNRLIGIRNSVRKFKKNSPKSKTIFIYKTPNYFRANFTKNWGISSPYPAYLQREIAFKVFGNPYVDDMRSDEFPVKVYDVYPMVLAAFEHMKTGDLHPPGFLALQTSNMLIKALEYFDGV